jgi:hypothetical protein
MALTPAWTRLWSSSSSLSAVQGNFPIRLSELVECVHEYNVQQELPEHRYRDLYASLEQWERRRHGHLAKNRRPASYGNNHDNSPSLGVALAGGPSSASHKTNRALPQRRYIVKEDPMTLVTLKRRFERPLPQREELLFPSSRGGFGKSGGPESAKQRPQSAAKTGSSFMMAPPPPRSHRAHDGDDDDDDPLPLLERLWSP